MRKKNRIFKGELRTHSSVEAALAKILDDAEKAKKLYEALPIIGRVSRDDILKAQKCYITSGSGHNYFLCNHVDSSYVKARISVAIGWEGTLTGHLSSDKGVYVYNLLATKSELCAGDRVLRFAWLRKNLIELSEDLRCSNVSYKELDIWEAAYEQR